MVVVAPRVLAALFGFVALVCSCGSDSEDARDESAGELPEASEAGDTPRVETSESTEAEATDDAESVPECLPVSDERLAEIALGSEGVTISPVAGAAYRSPDFEEVYFVAMEFALEGAENQVGVWVTNDLEGRAGFFAADVVGVRSRGACGERSDGVDFETPHGFWFDRSPDPEASTLTASRSGRADQPSTVIVHAGGAARKPARMSTCRRMVPLGMTWLPS